MKGRTYCPPRAGAELREQALRRTLEETRFPHQVWGIEGRMSDDFTNTRLTKRVLAEEAKVRLSLLRAVNF